MFAGALLFLMCKCHFILIALKWQSTSKYNYYATIHKRQIFEEINI